MKCPFNDPNFNIKFWEPCPVCGVKGGNPQEIDERCVEGLLGDKKLVGTEAVKLHNYLNKLGFK